MRYNSRSPFQRLQILKTDKLTVKFDLASRVYASGWGRVVATSTASQFIGCSLVSLLLLAANGASSAETSKAPDLFADAGEPRHAREILATRHGSPEFSQRTTTIDLGALGIAKAGVGQHDNPRVRLNLFHDAHFEGIVERVRPTATGYALSGRLAGSAAGAFTIVANGDVVAGDVRGPDGAYRIYGRNGTVRIERIDADALARCDGGLVPSHGDAPPVSGPGTQSAFANAPGKSRNRLGRRWIGH